MGWQYVADHGAFPSTRRPLSLSNLHNLLPPSSSLRLPTVSALIDIAANNGDLAAIDLSPSLIKTWIGEWEGVSDEQKAEFVEKVAAAVALKDECVSSSEWFDFVA